MNAKSYFTLISIHVLLFYVPVIKSQRIHAISEAIEYYTVETTPIDIPRSIDVYIGGVGINQFIYKQHDLENLALTISDAYCQYNFILPIQIHLRDENVVLQFIRSCPYDWPMAPYCIHARFSIHFDLPPYYLNINNLTAIWKDIESSSRFKELGFQPYHLEMYTSTTAGTYLTQTTTTPNVINILVTMVASLLLSTILIFLYINRKKIKELFSSLCHRSENNESVESINHNNDNNTFVNNHPYEKHFVPPLLHPNGNQTLSHLTSHNVQRTANPNEYVKDGLFIKQGLQNKGFVPDNTDKIVRNVPSAPSEAYVVDDFDSDDEINFPSPLKAPPLPPRPPKREQPPVNDKNNMHYMVTQITY